MGGDDWTEWDDSTGRCGADAVAPGERLTRIMHRRIGTERHPDSYFTRTELQHFGTSDPIENECGKSSGTSVMRRSVDDDALLNQQIDELLKGRSDFEIGGFATFSAGACRSIALKSQPNRQVIFVYDDPNEPNPKHAVIRIPRDLSKVDFNDARREMLRLLTLHDAGFDWR